MVEFYPIRARLLPCLLGTTGRTFHDVVLGAIVRIIAAITSNNSTSKSGTQAKPRRRRSHHDSATHSRNTFAPSPPPSGKKA
jgi:hypothetical protein